MYTLKLIPRPLPEGDLSSPQILNLTLSAGYDLAWTEFRPADHPDNHEGTPVLVVAVFPEPRQSEALEARVTLPNGALAALDLQVELHEGPYQTPPEKPDQQPVPPPRNRQRVGPNGVSIVHVTQLL